MNPDSCIFYPKEKFKLSENFIEQFKNQQPEWGPLGYITYKRCVTTDTPILTRDLRWIPAGDIKEGTEILSFDEYNKDGARFRTLQIGTITHNNIEDAECVEIELSDGTRLYSTPDHSWLVKKASNKLVWVEAKDLLCEKTKECYMLKYFDVWEEDNSYEGGYLAAAFDGEGCLDRHRCLSFCQVQNDVLESVKEYLTKFNFEYSCKPIKTGNMGKKQCYVIRISGNDQVSRFIGMFRPKRLMAMYLSFHDDMQLKRQNFRNIREIGVVKVTPIGKRKIAVISTSTKTHFTGGYPSHNTYSRYIEKEDRYEEFWETLRRVVEGCYTIQLNHCKNLRLPWNAHKSQKSAQKMYQMMWEFKFLPAGRMLWTLGTDIIWKKGVCGALNCAFASTSDLHYDFSGPFCWLMDMSLLGVGCGFDVAGAGQVKIQAPKVGEYTHVIEDSREGWVEAVRVVLESYVGKDKLPVEFDFSKIRPNGAPIKTFGGIAPGPDPLIECIEELKEVLNNRIDQEITSSDIVDLMNIVGKCVVSGGQRRVAELCLGNANDKEFFELKNPEKHGDLMKRWRWASNNSVLAEEGMDYTDLINQTIKSGEPGYVYLDNMRKYGRIKDGVTWKDINATGVNPCVTKDTLVAVADGRNAVTIGQLAEEGKDVPVYSVSPEGKVEIKMGRNPRVTGYDKEILEVVLDDNSSIKVTPNHKFLLKNGDQKEAKDLLPGDSLQRFQKSSQVFRKDGKKYSIIHKDIYNMLNGRESEHRMISKFYFPDKWNSVYDSEKNSGWHKGGVVVHHKDYNGLNNSPDNLEIMTFKEHQQYHADHDCSGENNGMYGREHTVDTKNLIGEKTIQRFEDENYRQRHKELVKEGMNKPEVKEKISNARKEKNKEWYLEFEKNTDLKTIWIKDRLYVVKNCEICKCEMILPVSKRERAYCSRECSNKAGDSVEARRKGIRDKHNTEEKLKVRNRQIEIFKDLEFSLERTPLRKEWEDACKENGVSFRLNTKVINEHGFKNFKEVKESASVFNHRVKEVRKLDERENVYNITVDDNHTVGYITHYDSTDSICSGIFTYNCGEQTLENYECCLLCETFPSNHDSPEEFHETLKYAYLLAKSITLVPSHNERTNQIMLRNRRIGLSMSGIVDAITKFGRRNFLKEYCDKGYDYIKTLDQKYSRWLCIPESIKVTTTKPSGCRPGDSLTSTDRGILTLDEIMGSHPEDTVWSTPYEKINVYNDTDINSITKTYRNGKSNTIKIQMSYNMVFECTPNHMLFVSKHIKVPGQKGKYKHVPIEKWVQAKDITPGDVVEINMNSYRNTNNALLATVDKPQTIVGSQGAEIKQPEYMSIELAWLMGYLYGDGSLSVHKYRTRFIDENKDNLQKAQKIILDVFGLTANIHKAGQGRNAWVLEIGSSHLWNFWLANGVNKFDENGEISLIPRCVRESSKESILSFISGLIDSDGCVFTRNGDIGVIISTTYDKFAKHIQEVGASVGLCFGRSLNTLGENKQKEKHMWLLTLNAHTDSNSLYTLIITSVKLTRYNNLSTTSDKTASFKCLTEPQNTLILGKVKSVVENNDPVDTFDIEVENKHWYYSGGVKSHNTVSLLPGVSPGIHFPHSKYYIRRIEFQKNSPFVEPIESVGYPKKQSVYKKNSWVFEFPVKVDNFYKSKNDVTVWEQMALHSEIQYYWSDNNVSQTVTFKKEEEGDLKDILESYEDKIKAVSFLPISDHSYEQAPYEEITEDEYNNRVGQIIGKVNFTNVVVPLEEDIQNKEKTKYCDGETCLI